SWPWVPESIALAHEQGNTYSIKKVVQFLRNKSISTSIIQNNLIKELPSSITLLHCNWIPNKKWPISQQVWNIGYHMLSNTSNISIPTTINDIIFPTQIPPISVKRAVKWLNINIVYEIWCLYTSSKWGNNIIKNFNITTLVTHQLNRELNVLKQIPHA
ncbi:22604_t:CDS:2, partial [Gigaspora rosea]